MKASLFGAGCIVASFALPLLVLSAEARADALWLPDILGMITIFVIAFIAGLVATTLCLLLFGTVIARFTREQLMRRGGLLIALAIAVFISAALGLVFEPSLTLIALPYALPAAVFYHREIKLEHFMDSANWR